MAAAELAPVITVYGGGHGPKGLERALIRRTPHLVSITSNHDRAGHSRAIIDEGLSDSALGDISQRMANHVVPLNPNEDPYWFFENRLPNGRRPINEIIAAAEAEKGGLHPGIRATERRISGYVGRTVSITDQKTDIQLWLSDGTSHIGEEYIDNMTADGPTIERVTLVPEHPTTNPEALVLTRNSDGIVISTGTWRGSVRIPLMFDGVADAINQAVEENNATVFWVCNAFNTKESEGMSPLDYIADINSLGIPVHEAYVNQFNYQFPLTYPEEGETPVVFRNDSEVREARSRVRRLHIGSHTIILPINEMKGGQEVIKKVVRHDGEMLADRFIQTIAESNVWAARRARLLHDHFNGK